MALGAEKTRVVLSYSFFEAPLAMELMMMVVAVVIANEWFLLMVMVMNYDDEMTEVMMVDL